MRSRNKRIRFILFDILHTFFAQKIRKLVSKAYINDGSTSTTNEILKVRIEKHSVAQIDAYSTIFLSLPTALRWRCVPGKFYRLRIEYSANNCNSMPTCERILTVRIATNIISRFHEYTATISSELAFNLFNGCVVEQIIMQVIKEIPEESLPTATEVHVAMIRQPKSEYSDYKIFSVNENLHSFFGVRRLLQSGDVFTYCNKKTAQTFFKVSFAKNSSFDDSPHFVHAESVRCYQTADVNDFFPGRRINTEVDFIPDSVHHVATKIRNVIMPYMQKATDSSSSHNKIKSARGVSGALNQDGPVVILVAGGADGGHLFMNYLCDLLCVNLVEFNCFDFWQVGDEKTEKLEEKFENAFGKANAFTPCVHWVQNVSILNNPNNQSAEPASSIIDTLVKRINSSEPNMIIILTCETEELSEVPQKLAKMVHFEFILEEICNNDREQFFEFFRKKFSSVQSDWFLNATRGFSLSELNQLLDDAREEALQNNRNVICHSDLEIGIRKRNKAIGKLIGVPEIPNITWDDIGGLEDVKQFISASLQLNSMTSNNDLTLRRSGIVLYGPPGCGKTLIAKAVANEFQMAFLSVKGPELLNQYIGQSEKNLREVFERARKASPSVLFFDELDSLAPNRGSAGDSGGVMDRMVSQLLTELDSIQWRTDSTVFVMGATNRPDLLDPCLLTPGRFDKSVLVKPADDIESKVKILRPICRKVKLEEGLTVEQIARKCPALISGAELQSVMSSAAMNSIREAIYKIESCISHEDKQKMAEAEEIFVLERHIDNALSEFTGAMTSATLQHYATLERDL
ncbi:ATPase family associated with various cellular activities (AAA) domain-containing protein [Ditylenchus destructor]|uniref:Peroxisomal ATPase PEX6 n=1 Tax=Ditylenchus destructor TaxID=166010 RepID=A0AAD4N7E6_9BILA|nr:ATPase family associated with various cellular activities (AAA) domain-containing protein [Ditylenchus destructor]